VFSGINFSKCFLAAAIFNWVKVVGIFDPDNDDDAYLEY
jgi:hypothetical protein